MTIEAIKPRFSDKLTRTTWLVNKTLGSETARHSKLKPQQINLLISIRFDRRMSLSKVSEHTGTTNDERTALILPLYEQGLIASHPFPNEPGIVLTQKGEETLKKLFPYIEACEQIALKGFSESEKEKFFNFLDRIQTNCITGI